MTNHKYGSKGHIVDAFITHIKGMTQDDWDKFYAARDAAWGAAGYAAWEAAWYAAGSAAGGAAGGAAGEIQGADLLRDRGKNFFFLPMFGFADEKAVLTALQPKESNQ